MRLRTKARVLNEFDVNDNSVSRTQQNNNVIVVPGPSPEVSKWRFDSIPWVVKRPSIVQLGDWGSVVSLLPQSGSAQSPGRKRVCIHFELKNHIWGDVFGYFYAAFLGFGWRGADWVRIRWTHWTPFATGFVIVLPYPRLIDCGATVNET